MLFVSTTLPSGQASGCVMLPQGSKQPLLISQREGDGLSPGTSDGAAVERSRALLGGVHGGCQVHSACGSKMHSKQKHTFRFPHRMLIDLSPHGQYMMVLIQTLSGHEPWILDFENGQKVLALPRTSGSSHCWHAQDGAIAYTQWVGAVDQTWDVHAVCLRTRSPLFTCTGHSGHMWLVAYVPCNAIVGFLKQECGP